MAAHPDVATLEVRSRPPLPRCPGQLSPINVRRWRPSTSSTSPPAGTSRPRARAGTRRRSTTRPPRPPSRRRALPDVATRARAARAPDASRASRPISPSLRLALERVPTPPRRAVARQSTRLVLRAPAPSNARASAKAETRRERRRRAGRRAARPRQMPGTFARSSGAPASSGCPATRKSTPCALATPARSPRRQMPDRAGTDRGPRDQSRAQASSTHALLPSLAGNVLASTSHRVADDGARWQARNRQSAANAVTWRCHVT